MNETEVAEVVEYGTIRREIEVVDLEVGDGRTIYGRCVPYDVEALVSDGGMPYREVCRRGMFPKPVVKASLARGVLLNWQHSGDLGNQIGKAEEILEREDGLYGTFRARPGVFGDQGLELIRDGSATGLSIQVQMHARGTVRRDDGLVERTRANLLEHVALTGSPAYPDAGILAVRALDEPPPGAAGTPMLDEVLEYLDRARYRARS